MVCWKFAKKDQNLVYRLFDVTLLGNISGIVYSDKTGAYFWTDASYACSIWGRIGKYSSMFNYLFYFKYDSLLLLSILLSRSYKVTNTISLDRRINRISVIAAP